MKIYWSLIIVVLLCNLSCTSTTSDNDLQPAVCEDEFLGTFEILESSNAAFPYLSYPSDTRFIFANAAGAEIVYQMDSIYVTNITTRFSQSCPDNQNVDIEYEYVGEMKSVKLWSNNHPLVFNVRLGSRIGGYDPTPESVFDKLSIDTYDSFVDANGMTSFNIFSIVVDERTADPDIFNPLFDPIFYPSIEINGRTLLDVHTGADVTNPVSEVDVYNSLETGIVAFIDLDNVQWVLDRIE